MTSVNEVVYKTSTEAVIVTDFVDAWQVDQSVYIDGDRYQLEEFGSQRIATVFEGTVTSTTIPDAPVRIVGAEDQRSQVTVEGDHLVLHSTLDAGIGRFHSTS